MPDRLPENAPAPDFDPKSLAKELLRATRAGSLATIDRNTGHPFASLVNVATDSDGSPVILVSRLSTHTANLEADGRASVLLAATGKGDPLAHPRLTLLGSFRPGAARRSERAAPAPPLPRPASEIGALCRLRRFLVLAARCGIRPSQWRLCPRRRPHSRRRDDGHLRRGRIDRSRGGRGRAYECRSRRRGAALRHKTSWRRGRAVAAHRPRPGRPRPRLRRRARCGLAFAERVTTAQQLRKVVVDLAANARSERGSATMLSLCCTAARGTAAMHLPVRLQYVPVRLESVPVLAEARMLDIGSRRSPGVRNGGCRGTRSRAAMRVTSGG